MTSSNTQEPPAGVNTYKSGKDVPEDRKKYWNQRRDLFTKFDEGIWMTDNAWFETTSEPIANKIAQEIKTYAPKEKRILIDCFCGVGGNSIAFALSGYWDEIYAIEKDPVTLACARHNAAIYGVKQIINFLNEDVFKAMERLKKLGSKAVIFASPPWGGPDYNAFEKFDSINEMKPYGLKYLYDYFKGCSNDLALYLPRNSNLEQIAELAKDGEKFDVVHYSLWGSSKAICFYSGGLSSA